MWGKILAGGKAAWTGIKGLFGGKGTLQIGKDNKTTSSTTTGNESPAISTMGDVKYENSKDSITVNATGPSSLAVGGDIVAPVSFTTIINNTTPQNNIGNIAFTLPAPIGDKYFIGRGKETGRIRQILNSAKGGRAAITTLKGMGGIGKSVLAIYVANKIKDKFPDGQFFIQMNGIVAPVSPHQVMTSIIRSFHPDFTLAPDRESELHSAYLSLLTGKRVLIVLDNARDAMHVRPLLPPVGCGLIVTSRQSLDSLDGVENIIVEQMSTDESIKLFRTLIGDLGSDEDLSIMAGLCGHLPLALNVAGCFLKGHRDWTIENYCSALRDEKLKRLKLGSDPSKDVEAVLALSANQLVRDNPLAACRWQELSIIDSDFDITLAVVVFGIDANPIVARDVLATLQDRSMVIYDVNNMRYRIHDLFRPIAECVFDWGESHELSKQSSVRISSAKSRYFQYSNDLIARIAAAASKTSHDDLRNAFTPLQSEMHNMGGGIDMIIKSIDGDATKDPHAQQAMINLLNMMSGTIALTRKHKDGKKIVGQYMATPEMAEGSWQIAVFQAELGNYQAAIESGEVALEYLDELRHPLYDVAKKTLSIWKECLANPINKP